jgi:hypothetical protein
MLPDSSIMYEIELFFSPTLCVLCDFFLLKNKIIMLQSWLACPIRWGQNQKACISKEENQDASSLCLNAIIILGQSE